MMRHLLCAIALTALVACGGSERGLVAYEAGNGPDEFSVLPAAPLVIPDVLTLPQPTPGGGNLTDIDPLADALVALGGNPSLAFSSGVPAADAALVAAVSAGGVTEDIRALLASEDAALRSRSGAFRLWGGDRYFQTYARQALDAYAELARFAALGVPVPSAPPI